MDAIVTAGGIPLPEDPLYVETRGRPKALLDMAGKPMAQWVLDALSESQLVERVVVVGLTEKSGLTCRKPLTFIPNQGKMLDNLRAGAAEVLRQNKKAGHVLIVSSDVPAITGEMIDWLIRTAMETDDDVYYNVIPREVIEARFPNARRTWTRLADMEVCGGDVNIARLSLMTRQDTDLWEKITNARKSPLRQAALIGVDTLLLLLFRKLTLAQAVEKVTKRLHIRGRAIVCPYAEIGMDVDKPVHVDILRADLKKRVRAAKRAAARKPPVASSS
jgi:GTP:adenosylcobinamide-phosphate guanylyltransferase